MVPKGIYVLLCALVASLCLSASASAVSIYFDVNADGLPDTDCAVAPGGELLVGVCLGGFAEETGSFQFDITYDDAVLTLIDYDTYMGQADEDPGLTGPIQTLAELGPWATTQWSEPITQELNQLGGGGGGACIEFYTAGSLTETATGDGVLAWLVFQVAGTGQTGLHLSMPGDTWFLEAVTEQPAPTDLTVSVVPEPSAICLLIAAVLVAGRKRLLLG